MKIIRTVCPRKCYDACAMLAHVEDGRLVMANAEPPIELPVETIESVQVAAPYRVPLDSFVLIDGDTPDAYWPYLAANIVLALVILGNVFVLALRLRRRFRAAR